jgi:hypothetical protein
MVFNATFNNISVISWQSVLLVEETDCISSYNINPTTIRSRLRRPPIIYLGQYCRKQIKL